MERKLIFMDGEFTKLTTKGVNFLSLALITEEGKELYLEIEQDKNDIDPWVQENVIPLLNGNAVTKEEAKEEIIEFVKENYGEDKPVLVADVNQFDWNGICELFGVWDIPFFYIPIDFSSILFTKGIDIDVDRIELAKNLGISIEGFKQHNALTDTKILKATWDKLK
ncbi:3'-5' exonuclease family protein [Clostridium brassicae]|uniref:3'-5' exoribonuclease n=1 Tax=Clostridium brassicae TaxID=2999072 RepID=A0ABT4D6H8_9CLOT|nr:3'-5' exoribonuclease [Clostridium brassicae]MCY6957882.1 3'-5' exoribonuclease [Clostridium brassicae]